MTVRYHTSEQDKMLATITNHAAVMQKTLKDELTRRHAEIDRIITEFKLPATSSAPQDAVATM
jgi:hypothetical protein